MVSKSSAYLSNFGFIIGSFRTEESNISLPLPTLLAAHAAPLSLPDLAARHLDVAGTASGAGKGWYGLGYAAWVLQHVDDRSQVTLISNNKAGQASGEEDYEHHSKHKYFKKMT